MGTDLRKRFEQHREQQRDVMNAGHQERFLKRLEQEFPRKGGRSKGFGPPWGIAASVAILIGLSLYFFMPSDPGAPQGPVPIGDHGESGARTISLGDLSPDFKKIETYYTTHINLQISDLVVNKGNGELIDGYMQQLGALDREYQNLNRELNELGPNDQTIGALVRNLQIRLELLQKLKSRMDQLKSSKNEQESFDII